MGVTWSKSIRPPNNLFMPRVAWILFSWPILDFRNFMAVLVGVIIIGGIKSIAKVTDKVVPLMVGVYVLSALVVLGVKFLPHSKCLRTDF